MEKAKFICTADWHLRNIPPRCRIDDDWLKFQESIITFIVNKANEKNCDLVIVGDLFHTPNVPANITSSFINKMSLLKNKVHILVGNHDLPFHSIDDINHSSIGILSALSKEHIKIKMGMEKFGQWIDFNDDIKGKEIGLLFIHRLVVKTSQDMYKNSFAITADELLELYPKTKWIFTGDNHHNFHYKSKGRHVLNPGCIYRGASDLKEYKPVIFYVDTEEELVESIELPDNGLLVDDSYIIKEEERNNRIESFVELVKNKKDEESDNLDFFNEIQRKIEKKGYNISKDTIDMINFLMEVSV